MNKPAKQRRSWLGLALAALLVLLAFAVLVGLGTWQLERKAWKEGLIAELTERLEAPPAVLPPAPAWSSLDRPSNEYHRVTFSGTFDHGKEALIYGAASAFRPDVSGVGYWVFTPARLADGAIVMVNRGFVSQDRKEAASRAQGQIAGPVEIVGVMRWPDARGFFSPHDDPAHNLWFARDPKSIADAKGVGSVAPFYVEQESPIPPGGLPQPGKLIVNLRNAHLQYAITWYGLALALLAVFVAWAFKSGREATREDTPQHPRSPLRSL